LFRHGAQCADACHGGGACGSLGRKVGFDKVQQGVHALAAIGQHLAHQQVDRLDLVGALVNHGHAGVTDVLFDAPFAHIAVATKHLQAVAAAMKSLVREDRLHDGRDQGAPALCKRLCFGRAVLDLVKLNGRLVGQHAAGIHPGALGVQNAAHGRVFGNQVGLAGTLAFARCAHLAAFLRIGVGLLPGGVQQADALQGHMQTCRVHHDEHRVQAFARLAHDLTARFFKAHHAGGAAVQAHFFFDAVAMHTAAGAVRIELGHQEQRQAFGAGRGIGQARQHQVHDVVGQVVLTARDEDLGARKQVAAVRLRHGLGAAQAQVGARVRLGQAHGGQPFAGGHFFQILRFEFVAGVVLDALVGAMQQARRHGPAMVGGRQHFIEHGFEHAGQPLAAVFGARRQRRPARLPERLVSVAETGWHRDRAVFPPCTDLVAVAVERGNHFAHELAGLTQHLLHQVRIDFTKGGQGLQLCRCVQDAGEHKVHLIGARGVGVHGAVCRRERRTDQASAEKPMSLTMPRHWSASALSQAASSSGVDDCASMPTCARLSTTSLLLSAGCR